MPTILKDASITAISLVDRGANLKKIFLYKRADDATPDTASANPGALWESQLIKAGRAPDEWSTFYCVVAVPNEVDQQGDVWTADEIRKAAHDFVEGGGLINFMHKTMEPVGKLVESSIALEEMRVNGEHIPKGSWYIAVRPNPEMKKAIERGEVTGISVQGSARREPVFTPGIDSPGTVLHTITKAGVRTLDGKSIKEGQTVHLVNDPSKAFIVLGEHPETGRLVLGNVQGQTVEVDGLDLITTQTAQAKMEQLEAAQAPTPMRLEYSGDGKSPFSQLYETTPAAESDTEQGELSTVGKAEAVLDGEPGMWRTIRGARAFVGTGKKSAGRIMAGPDEIRGVPLEKLGKRPDVMPPMFAQPVVKDINGRQLHRGDYVSHVLNPAEVLPVVELAGDSVVVEVRKDGYPFPMQSMVSPRQLVYSSGPIGGRGALDDLTNALIDDFDDNSMLRDALGRHGIYKKDQIEGAVATGQLTEEHVRELIKLVDGAADSSDDRNIEGTLAVEQGLQQNLYKSAAGIDRLVHLLNETGASVMGDSHIEKAVPKHPAAKCAVGGCSNCIPEGVEKYQKPFPGAAPPFTEADGGKRKKKHEVGVVDSKGDQYLPNGEQVEDADLIGMAKGSGCTCGDPLCKGMCSAKQMAKASGQALQWAPSGTTEGDLDDGDFAWLSDAYLDGEESASEGRKLPYKINGEVNERGWRAAWSMASKANLDGGPDLNEVRRTLLDDRPEGIEVSDEGEMTKGMPMMVGGKMRLHSGMKPTMNSAGSDNEASEAGEDDEGVEHESAPPPSAIVMNGRLRKPQPVMPEKVRLNPMGRVEKHFELGNPHSHPHGDQPEPAVKAGGFPPTRTPDQPMGGKMPAAPAPAEEKPKMSREQKAEIVQQLMQVAQSGDRALLEHLKGMNVRPEQLPLLDIPEEHLMMMQQKFLLGPGRRSATTPAQAPGFKPPADQAQQLIDSMTKMVAQHHGVDIPMDHGHPHGSKKRLPSEGGTIMRGQGVRLGMDGSVKKMADEIQPGKLFIGPDGKRYIAREVTESSVVGFAGGREIRVPRGQVKLAHGSVQKRDNKVGERLPFPEGLLAETDPAKGAHFSTDDVVEVPDGTVARVYDVSDDKKTVTVTYPHNNLPRRREYPYDQVKLFKAAVREGAIVMLKDESAAEVESVEGQTAVVVTVGKDLKERRRKVNVADLEVLDGSHKMQKTAPRPGSMHGHDPRKYGKIRHIVRQFGKWAGGKHSICVARLRTEHPEVAKGRENQLCFAPGTLVETRDRGMVAVEDIAPFDESTGQGDWVRTHAGRWMPVLGTRSNMAGDRKMYRFYIENSDLPVEVTEDHPLLIARGTEFYEGSRIRKRNKSARVAAGLDVETRSSVETLYPTAAFGAAEKITAADVREHDYFLTAVHRDTFAAPVSDDYLWLIGMYAAEGKTLEKDSDPRWCFGPGDSLVQECLERAEREFGCKFRIASYRTADCVVLEKGQPGAAKEVAERIKMGVTANVWTKRFAAWVLDLPVEQLQIVVDAYWAGDGHVRPDGREAVATTVSRDLAYQLRSMLLYLGLRPSIKQIRDHREEVIEGRVVKGAPTWSVYYTPLEYGPSGRYRKRHAGLHRDDYVAFPIQKIEVVDAPEWVYTLHVAGDNTLHVNGFLAYQCAYLKDQWAGTTHWRKGRQGVVKDASSEMNAELEAGLGYIPTDDQVQELFELFCEMSGHDPAELESRFEGLDVDGIEDLLESFDGEDSENVDESLAADSTTSSTLSGDDVETSSQSDQAVSGFDKAREVIKRALGIQQVEESPNGDSGVVILKAMESLATELMGAAGEDDEDVRVSRTSEIVEDFSRWLDRYQSSAAN